MNKKSLIGIMIGVVIVLAAGAVALYFLNRPKPNDRDTSSDQSTIINEGASKVETGKILVAYYSAQNHTKNVAEKIAANLGADLFEITPVEIYTEEDLDWTADGSRVNREHEDISLRDIELATTEVPNWSEYNTVLLGYPIWWGIAAWPVDNFVKANNFAGKTVIPFCTSTSSGIGQSDQLLSDLAGSGNWQTGHRFSSNPSDSDIQAWVNSIR